MSNKYTREILRRNVAQMCQTIGWHSINSTPLDILTHVLEKYILTLGTQANHYAEQFNRSEPNLHDLGLVFRDLHVHVPELAEFVRSVPAAPSALQVEPFPKPKESHLNFLKPGSHEVVTRPVHVHEHLPAMYPDKEKESSPIISDAIQIRQNGHAHLDQNDLCDSPEISVTDSPDKPRDIFKRPNNPVGLSNMKKPRLRLEDEDCHTREISSVMMTMSGFLSPAREGKLPEAKTPAPVFDRHLDRSNHSQSSMSGLPPHMFSEKVDKKSKKSKLLNGKVMKSKKKDKSHRGDSEKLFGIDRRVDKLSNSKKKVPSAIPNHMLIATTSVAALPSPSVPSVDTSVKHIKQENLNIIPEVHRNPPTSVTELEILPALALHTPLAESTTRPCSPLPPIMAIPTPAPLTKPYNNHVLPVKVNHSPVKENVESEKLTSQPDRSKLNIFKKISSKPKEERPPMLDVLDKYHHMNSFGKSERLDRIPPSHVNKPDVNTVIESTTKPKPPPVSNHIESSAAIDLSYKQVDLKTNEVINIDDDSFDFDFKLPQNSPTPNDKLNSVPNVVQKEAPLNSKVKKERKKKTPKEKQDKILREYSKLLKKQQMAEAQAAALRAEKMDFSAVQSKPPKSSRPRKTSSKHQNFSQAYPFLPMQPVPRPRLIPNPGLVRGDLFMGLANNPALRGILPPHSSGLLMNPFSSLPTGPGLIPRTSFLPTGPGLIPPGMPNPLLMSHSFGQPPRMSHTPSRLHPLLRRPSLEVIPVNNDQPDTKQLSPVRQLQVREKQDKIKMSSIPNILQKQKSRPLVKDTASKSNPVIKMPPIHPDITITELNTSPKLSTRVEPVEELSRAPSPPPVPTSPPASNGPSRESPLHDLPHERDKDKPDKKKDKLHKKEKKDKDLLKIKKKKEKKDKHKDKSEKKKDKEVKDKLLSKEKIKKEKKEKRKDKEKPFPTDGVVPKLTLKLGSASPMTPNSPDVSFKLNIKPVIKREDEGSGDSTMSAKEGALSPQPCPSPELATISALVTRPPKSKSSKPSLSNEMQADSGPSESSPPQTGNHSPSRKNKTPSSFSKYKRILFKPIPKKSGQMDKIIIDSETEEEIQTPRVVPVERPVPVTRPALVAPPASSPLASGTPYYTDEQGNKVWVCPGCSRPDNGTPMIGCDGCDGWYHWVCVGVTVDPGDSEDWFCGPCVAKQHAMATALAGGTRKRGRKPKHREH